MKLSLQPRDDQRLILLCGPANENLRLLESLLPVDIKQRGHDFELIGDTKPVETLAQALVSLYEQTANDQPITTQDIHLILPRHNHPGGKMNKAHHNTAIEGYNGLIKGKTPNQCNYLGSLVSHDINFAVGPAGTGKTFLAVAAAVQALKEERVDRIILVRPAVEAGENLGFLPGDLSEKIDPYLRPLFDALTELLGPTTVEKLISKHVIELAPLAYMRGRTLNNAYVILDEGQNSTREQMKMFLTRIGFGSKAVITGDISQIDLPRKSQSGLTHAIDVLQGVDSIFFSYFDSGDVVRHPLVQKIIDAYDAYEATHQAAD